MAVWTRGSTGWKTAFWIWLSTRTRALVASNPAGGDKPVDEDVTVNAVPEDLRDDLALPVDDRPANRQEAFWRGMQRSRRWPRF